MLPGDEGLFFVSLGSWLIFEERLLNR